MNAVVDMMRECVMFVRLQAATQTAAVEREEMRFKR
jgi:hypothetical protein